MAVFVVDPDWEFNCEEAPKVARAQFGDGFSQRSADGINNNPRRYRLTFGTRTTAEMQTIRTFLRDRGGVESFDWTPPDDDAGKWICPEWSRVGRRAGIHNMTAIFEEVFEG
ncbi:MAG: phage tail protein [Amphiplicatus sp.]